MTADVHVPPVIVCVLGSESATDVAIGDQSLIFELWSV